MNSYTLTQTEADVYDNGDDGETAHLMASLSARFGRVAGGATVTTEVCHPDGFVVEAYTAAE